MKTLKATVLLELDSAIRRVGLKVRVCSLGQIMTAVAGFVSIRSAAKAFSMSDTVFTAVFAVLALVAFALLTILSRDRCKFKVRLNSLRTERRRLSISH